MYHIILIAMAATLLLGVWNLVHSSPRSIVLLLPRNVAFFVGAFLLVYGAFFAFAAAVLVQNGGAMLWFLWKGHVGLYFLLVLLREDETTVRRAFLLMATLDATIIAIFFTHDPVAASLIMVAMLTAGYYLLTSNSRFLDRQG